MVRLGANVQGREGQPVDATGTNSRLHLIVSLLHAVASQARQCLEIWHAEAFVACTDSCIAVFICVPCNGLKENVSSLVYGQVQHPTEADFLARGSAQSREKLLEKKLLELGVRGMPMFSELTYFKYALVLYI